MIEPTSLRIRLVFSNEVLNKSQKKNGLKRSWLLVKQHHQTISDVISYLVHSFDLFDSCPNGITLYMEGFVLPEFESTSILKDKDLIRVKRKEIGVISANKVIQDANTYIEDAIVEKQPILPCVRLLTNERFIEDDEDKDEAENRKEDSASKKIKASTKLENSKKKRKREAIVNTVQKKHPLDSEHITQPNKKRKHDNKSNQNAVSCPSVTEKCANDLEPESYSKSENDDIKEDVVQASGMPDKAKKVSRSTLRRRSKNIFKRLHREMEERDKKQPVKDTGSKKDAVASTISQSDEDSDGDGDLVPVEIRPGLIRYVPSGKVKEVQEANTLNANSTQNGTSEEHSKHNQVEKEAHCWNGIANKRKGQKWGQAKQSNSAWKESNNDNTHSSWDDRLQSTSSWKDSKDVNGSSSSAWPTRNGKSSNSWADKKYSSNHKPVDFDKLIPLIDPPKAGDIVAYRLLELSSTWCPELSSFRVGKITSFEPESDKIVLVPVPEYPFNIEKKVVDDADQQPLGFSVYNEDGSLETDFPSLNDVRIVKLGNLTPSEGAKMPTANGSSAPSTSKMHDEAHNATQKLSSETSNQELHTSIPGPSNSKKDAWEEIAEAAAAKKAQQMQDNWNKKQTPSKRQWSSRSLRGSGMGPTMGRLRGRNQNGA